MSPFFRKETLGETGFTLIELLVVTAIIMLLTAFALPVYAHIMDNARRSRSAEDQRVIEQALDAYHAERGHYPNSLVELVTRGYVKDASPTHKTLRSPWYDEDDNHVWYFYAIDVEDVAQAYILGDSMGRVPCGTKGMSTQATLSADPTVPLPCGRNPETKGGPWAYVWGPAKGTLTLDPDDSALRRKDLRSSR